MHVGILGGGQLAQMLALAGIPLGIRFTCLESKKPCSASSVATIIEEDYSKGSVKKLASCADVLTFESENIDARLIDQPTIPLYPSLKALQVTQDRLFEKEFLSNLHIPVADFFSIEKFSDLTHAIKALGYPCVLKTRRQGYDGKGQYVIQSEEEAFTAFQSLSSPDQTAQALIAEKWIHFDREVSLIAVRSHTGQIKFYPLAENIHQSGILRLSRAPYCNEALAAKTQCYLKEILEAFDYVGVLSVEFFVLGEQILVNEMAPRVHNSGHWTIEGAQTSQFENHLRAILKLPLGDTNPVHHATMVNFIGEVPDLEKLMKIPSSHVHLYGKSPQKGRKLGHLTLISEKPLDEQNCTFLLSLNRVDS